jgi:hypothetical protein
MRIKLLGAATAAALGLAFTPALAAGPSGYIDGGYGYINSSSCSGCGHLNEWNVTGSGNMPLGGSHFSAQVDGEYHGLSGTGSSSLHWWQADLSLMWSGSGGKVGATAGTNEFGASGLSFRYQNYGAFAVGYAGPSITLGMKAGEVSCSGCHNSNYWGGEVIGYPMPNLAISGRGDTATLSGSTFSDWNVGGEWQPTQTPWSVRLGYNYSKLPIGPALNTYSIGFRWYFGGNGTLVQHHRDGDETWGTRQTALGLIF